MPKPDPSCRLCRLPRDEILMQGDHAIVIAPLDHPESRLVVPTVHAASLADLPPGFWADLTAFDAQMAAERLTADLSVDRNLSFNLGLQAGQSALGHAHCWVIYRDGGNPSSGWGMATLLDLVDKKYGPTFTPL